MPWKEWFRRKPTGPRRPLVEEITHKTAYRVENAVYYHGREKASIEDVIHKLMALGFRAHNRSGALAVDASDPVDAIREFTDDLGAIDRVLLELSRRGDKCRG